VITTRFARLSHRQWESATRDLLKLPAAPGYAASFTGDPVRGHFDNNGGLLQVTSGLRNDYQRAAEALAEKIAGDAVALQRILPEGLPADPAARARGFVEGFGLRAYRRPLTSGEVARYVALFGKGRDLFGGKDPFADGVRVTLEAFLQSHHFLYRTELQGGAAGARSSLDPYEVASKLSFTLASTMPDAELFGLAANEGLASRDTVRAQAERLLGRPAAREILDDFHAQLLRLATYEQIDKDTKLFPEFVAGIGNDMRQETLGFTRDVVFGGDARQPGGLRELLTAPYSLVNKRLAAIYRVTGPATDALVRHDLNPAERAGLLTQPGFLASNAHKKEVDSIHRGVFVHHAILCTSLPPPAEGVSLSNARGVTNRQRVTSVTGDGTCGAGCHSTVINPVGFAFEHYDALGRYRRNDNGSPVDATGTYDFGAGPQSWRDAVGFVKAVSEGPQAHECFARNLLEYVHGRVPEAGDDGIVRGLGARSLDGRATVRALVLDLVTSDEFLTRLP
jgi:hypothetical protein